MENMPMVTPSRCRLCEVKESKIAGLQRDLEAQTQKRDEFHERWNSMRHLYEVTLDNLERNMRHVKQTEGLLADAIRERDGFREIADERASVIAEILTLLGPIQGTDYAAVIEAVRTLRRERDEARRALREAKESGDRLALLVTAACDLIRVNSLYEYTATWDETTCDGYCFLDDAKIALHEWKRDAAAYAAKEE